MDPVMLTSAAGAAAGALAWCIYLDIATAEEIADLIIVSCDEVDRKLQEIASSASGLVRKSLDRVRVGGVVPLDPVTKETLHRLAMEAIGQFIFVARQGVDLTRRVAKCVGRPSLLRVAAEKLDAGVAQAGANMYKSMTPNRFTAHDSEAWLSKAVSPYLVAFDEQKSGVNEVTRIGEDIAKDLRRFADGVDKFYRDTAEASLGISIAILGVVGIITTGWTGVGGFISVITTVAGIVMTIKGLVSTFSDYASACKVGCADDWTWPNSAFAQ